MPMTFPQKLLIGTALSVPVVAYAYAKYAVSTIAFNLTSVNLSGLSIDGSAQVVANFTLSSAIGIEFIINGLYLNIWVDGTFVGTATQTSVITVPKTGTIPISVEVQINTLNVVQSLGTIIGSAAAGSVNYTIQGMLPVQVNLPILSFFSINYPVTASGTAGV